jgi:quercetin dioxygenase-like cupin family protein
MKSGMRRWWMVGLVAALGCAGLPPRGPALAIGALRHELTPYLEAHPLPPGTEIRADLLERTSGASLHVVQVHGRERPHRHLEHDLVIHVLRGEGVLTLEGAEIPLRAGDVVLIKRGATHWFASAPGSVAVALVTFAPPLDAPDSVPTGDVDSGDAGR